MSEEQETNYTEDSLLDEVEAIEAEKSATEEGETGDEDSTPLMGA